jgi:hypothetical protein
MTTARRWQPGDRVRLTGTPVLKLTEGIVLEVGDSGWTLVSFPHFNWAGDPAELLSVVEDQRYTRDRKP